MPNCIQFYSKDMGESPTLQELDIELCQVLRLPVHPTQYIVNWYNVIAFQLALGKSFGDIRQSIMQDLDTADAKTYKTLRCGTQCSDREHVRLLLQALDYLQEHYTANTWAE